MKKYGNLPELLEALDQQCDNIAFILNRVNMPGLWVGKFEKELKAARDLMKLLYVHKPKGPRDDKI